MTLFNKIAIIVSSFLLVLLIAVLMLNFKTASEFVQNQLYTDAEDTATSLGLSLSTAVGSGDVSMMDTMINAVFDRGYYQDMILEDVDGNVLIRKHLDMKVKDVPAWFIDRVALKVPMASVEVSAGWMPFGRLTVRSHAGHAYMQLWHIFTKLMGWFVGLSVAALAILYVMLKIILHSLQDVRRQAEAVNENSFIILEEIPGTKEFKEVVLAMNSMVGKVQSIFEKEAETLQKYHELLYTDGVTKLYNRRYFMGELSGYFQSETLSSGSILFLSFNDILVAKQAIGFAKLDELLKGFADLLIAEGGTWNDVLIARLGGQDFVVLAPNVPQEAMMQHADVILEKSRGMINSYGIDASAFYLSGAVSAYSGEDTIKNLLSRTDFALTAAKAKGAFAVEAYRDTGSATSLMGKEEWAQEIQAAMEEGRIRLAMQSVMKGDAVYHDEVYLRFEDREGTIHNAGYFMPMLIRLGLTNEVDRHVFSQVLAYIGKTPGASLAVNVSTDFIKDGAMLYWLTQQLKANKTPISFEISNGQVLRDISVCSDFAAMVRSFGNRFGIDNFSTQSGDMNYLKELKPAYIKAHKNMLLEDAESEESKAVFKSLQIIAESLGILFIAVAVENDEEKEKLAAMGIEAMQGSGVGAITMMEKAHG